MRSLWRMRANTFFSVCGKPCQKRGAQLDLEDQAPVPFIVSGLYHEPCEGSSRSSDVPRVILESPSRGASPAGGQLPENVALLRRRQHQLHDHHRLNLATEMTSIDAGSVAVGLVLFDRRVQCSLDRVGIHAPGAHVFGPFDLDADGVSTMKSLSVAHALKAHLRSRGRLDRPATGILARDTAGRGPGAALGTQRTAPRHRPSR